MTSTTNRYHAKVFFIMCLNIHNIVGFVIAFVKQLCERQVSKFENVMD
jgi:hypothetical protein